jgi:hypothetical protein
MAQKLSNLPIGAKIKFGRHSVNSESPWDLVWVLVAKNHNSTPAYPTNSVTFLTEKIIDLRCVDAEESRNPNADIREYGNVRYSLSNLDQWLNKDDPSGAWFEATHQYDTPPDTTYAAIHWTHYEERPGFMYLFTNDEKAAILDTNIRVMLPQVGTPRPTEDIVRKIFIPSLPEVGLTYDDAGPVNDGNVWEYFVNNSNVAYPTAQVCDNTLSELKPANITDSWQYWARSASADGHSIACITSRGRQSSTYPTMGDGGVRPAMNLSSEQMVSDSTDSNGYYTIVFNLAPFTPSSLIIPNKIYGGKSNVISWSVATDPNDERVTYQLECSVNGGTYNQIYSGESTTYAHLVPFGTTSVAYRVKATDPSGESSAYKTSATITVINNYAPVISGADANLGVKSSGFTGTYTITDANNNAVTVTEAIDGVQIRSLVATLGQAITYGVSENTWLALPNGSHTLTIRATDGIDTSVRTYTFTKLVNTLKIQNATPWVSSTMPSRIMLVVTRNIPSAATFKVEVCNNGYDASPTWEDCTDAVRSGLVHVFSNAKKTATNWGVLVRVTVARNGATGACYISAIGGNFE